uniref:Putative secreted protein n=1 Tax=Anopheles triannulatus TaxID=58253 RepID=A0A2M4B2X8_9DIPT
MFAILAIATSRSIAAGCHWVHHHHLLVVYLLLDSHDIFATNSGRRSRTLYCSITVLPGHDVVSRFCGQRHTFVFHIQHVGRAPLELSVALLATEVQLVGLQPYVVRRIIAWPITSCQ